MAGAGHIYGRSILMPCCGKKSLVVEIWKIFGNDARLPIPLSKDSIHLIYQICDVHVFLRKRMLVYVLAIPLVSKGNFDVLNVIPVPVVLGDKNLVYVNVEK